MTAPGRPANAVPSPAEIYADPSVSYWLKDAVRASIQRDPVDALRDAELLLAVLRRVADRRPGQF